MDKPIPVAPSLKKMNLYDSIEFSLTQYTVVNATIQRIRTESGKSFIQKKNTETKKLKVTRTA